MLKTFADYRIDIHGATGGEVDTTCPECSAQRKKKSARCLSVNVDKGTWLCHHCGYAGGLSEGERRHEPGWRKPVYRRPETKLVEFAPEDRAPEWFAKRGIPRAVLERNRVTATRVYMPQVEDHVKAIAFPYYRGDELVNVKYRDKDKNFRMEAGAERILYGLNDIGESVVIVEGEIDKLSCEVAGYTSCVSVPDGAPSESAKNYASKFSFLEADQDRLEQVSEWIIAVDNDPPGKRLEEELARRFGREKCKRVTWPEGCKDANDVLRRHGADVLRETLDRAEPFPIEGVIALEDLSADIDTLYENGWQRGLDTGWREVDELYTVRPGELTVITGIPNSGKALALDTPVPTPSGWTTMGALRVGDVLYDESGKECRVMHSFDVMIGRPCYEVEFSDGSKIVADAEHLWVTRTDKARRSAIQAKRKRGDREETLPRGTDQRHKRAYPSPVTTREIAETLRTKEGRFNHAVAVAGPIEGCDVDLPIPPYTLGAWLGDGASACGAVTAADVEVVSAMTADGYVVTRMPSTKYGHTVRGLIGQLRTAGLLLNKHIPRAYLRASVEQRKALLAGLMDTDGHISVNGRCEFCSTSEVLARGVFELVASLGMTPVLSVGRATLNGMYCGEKYRVCFTPIFNPFRIDRKSARFVQPAKARRVAYRRITAVRPVPSVPVRCISVDSQSHQFLVGHAFIPTHNSNFVDALAVNLAALHGWRIALFSPENMPLHDHAARLCEKYARAPFFDGPTLRMGRSELEAAKAWVQEHFFWILPTDDDDWTLDKILDSAKALVFRKGINGLVIDPWNELEHYRPREMTQTEYIGKALKQIRHFARRHSIHIWVVAHPAKLYRDKDGRYPVPTLYDISDSANWRNKCDCGIVVWRDFKSNAPVEIHVQKIRFRQVGKLGIAKLEYVKATATYRDLPFMDPRHE